MMLVVMMLVVMMLVVMIVNSDGDIMIMVTMVWLKWCHGDRGDGQSAVMVVAMVQ